MLPKIDIYVYTMYNRKTRVGFYKYYLISNKKYKKESGRQEDISYKKELNVHLLNEIVHRINCASNITFHWDYDFKWDKMWQSHWSRDMAAIISYLTSKGCRYNFTRQCNDELINTIIQNEAYAELEKQGKLNELTDEDMQTYFGLILDVIKKNQS